MKAFSIIHGDNNITYYAAQNEADAKLIVEYFNNEVPERKHTYKEIEIFPSFDEFKKKRAEIQIDFQLLAILIEYFEKNH